MKKMQIDIVSDVVCPWCYVGKKRLEEALKLRPNIEFNLIWRPFQLNPDMPKEGMDYQQYYQDKFGDKKRVKQIRKMMAEAGLQAGIGFHFEKIEKSPNTMDAHRLLRWSMNGGDQHALQESLFEAYFVEGRDVGDVEVLADIAESHGMKREIVLDLLKTDRDVPHIEAEIDVARNMGVNSVPCFIFDGKVALSGAQDPLKIIEVIDKVASMPSEDVST